jgi:hypothetical protein
VAKKISNKKYECGYEKKKKRRVKKIIESQRGALDKFVSNNNNDINSNGEQIVKQWSKLHTNIELVGQSNINDNIQEDENVENISNYNINQENETNLHKEMLNSLSGQ